MVQWFKKQADKKDPYGINMNRDEVKTQMNNLSSHFGKFKDDAGFRAIKELIALAANHAALDMMTANKETLDLLRGRHQALRDLLNYLDAALEESKSKEKEKPQVRGQVRLVRRTDNQAGASL
jgi:hypothetical protein